MQESVFRANTGLFSPRLNIQPGPADSHHRAVSTPTFEDLTRSFKNQKRSTDLGTGDQNLDPEYQRLTALQSTLSQREELSWHI